MTVFAKKNLNFLKYNNFTFFLILIIALFVMSNVSALLKLYSISIDFATFTFIIKAARDFCIYLCFLFWYFSGVFKKYLYLNAAFVLIFLLSTVHATFLNVAWGLRFFLPLFFLITPYQNAAFSIKRSELKKILNVFLIVHVTLQVLHLIFGKGYFAMFTLLHLNARNPGLLFFPAASAFLTLSLFVVSFCIDSKVKHLGLFCLSIFLSSSITGAVTFLVLIIILYKQLTKIEKLVMPIYFLLTFLVLHLARYAMTGASYLNETAGGRAKIFRDSILNSKIDFSNNNFGTFTNGSAGHFGGVAIDSLYAALLSNISIFWLVLLILLFSFYLFVQRRFLRNKKTHLIATLFLLTSAGMITTEVTFPFMLLVLAKIITVQNAEEA